MSQRDNSEDPFGNGNEKNMTRGMSTSARKIKNDMEKTIDSEDEDGIVQHRERSRATHKREGSDMKEQQHIKLLNVNIPSNIVAATSSQTTSNAAAIKSSNLARLPINDLQQKQTVAPSSNDALTPTLDEKDLLLQKALDDKQKLLNILSKVRKTFHGFKKRHTDLVGVSGDHNNHLATDEDLESNSKQRLSAGESGCTDRSNASVHNY